jgi:hypothetical protein
MRRGASRRPARQDETVNDEHHVMAWALPGLLSLGLVLAGCRTGPGPPQIPAEDHPDVVRLERRLAEAEGQVAGARRLLRELGQAEVEVREGMAGAKADASRKRSAARAEAGAPPELPAERQQWEQQLAEKIVRISTEEDRALARAHEALADLAARAHEAREIIRRPGELRNQLRRSRRWIESAGRPATWQLDRQVAAIDLDDLPLYDALATFREEHGTNLYVDWRTLAAAGIRGDRKVSYSARKVRVRDALEEVLRRARGERHRAAFAAEDNVVVVSTPAGLARSAKGARRIESLAIPPRIDERFDSRIEHVSFIDIPLGDALCFFGEVLRTDEEVLTVPWEELQAAGVDKETEISMDLRNPRIGHALRLMLDQAGGGKAFLALAVRDGKLTVRVAPNSRQPGRR